MVHLSNGNVGDTGNHNKLFYSLELKLNRIGVRLREEKRYIMKTGKELDYILRASW